MAEGFKEQEKVDLVRNKLKSESVKLWLSPFTADDGTKGEHPQDLISRYSNDLKLDEQEIATILEQLRSSAVQKLSCKKRFQETAVASLKVKLSGKFLESCEKSFSVDFSLKAVSSELKNKVSSMTSTPVERLKLICAGKVLDDNVSLLDQNVKNLSTIMVLCLSESEAEARHRQEEVQKVAKTREAAEYLSSKVDGGADDNTNYYLQVADQSGNIINMPPDERKALVMAMTLHEKGKAALKRKQYGEALLLLLEADKEFSVCRSSILESVDNYAILCLEIVWCHLCLQNVDDLPDAERRLDVCDECFRKSYGPNLERLQLLRGGTGMEKALFMRLHLLQAILAYHKHRLSEAKQLLLRAENELKSLQVDDTAMSQVIAMGFTQQEARLALRVCEGNVQVAISHIMSRREERETRRAKEKEEKRKKKLTRKLGKTASGAEDDDEDDDDEFDDDYDSDDDDDDFHVNIDAYESLQSMGFPKGAAAEALRQSNNDITLALQVLQEQPSLLELSDPEVEPVKVTEEMIDQVSNMGFERNVAEVALKKFSGNVEKAVEELLKVAGEIPAEWLQEIEQSGSWASASSSSSDVSPTKSTEEEQREKEREKEAIDNIIPDIPEDEVEHLDLCLDEEATYLEQYKALIDSVL